jgi:aminopeptidase N
VWWTASAAAQLFTGSPATFTRADTLRGMLTPPRACYDVRSYVLDVRIDPAAQSIAGSTTMRFDVVADTRRMQVDLFRNMRTDGMVLDGTMPVRWTREEDALFVELPRLLRSGEHHELVIAYSGSPRAAKRAPWDGGFVWTADSTGHPWVAVACQGTGASLWWPNKDHQSDEPDSMLIRVTVPPGLMDVSNGRLRGVTTLADGWSRYDWFVSSPINNYCVTVNVGRFAHFTDLFAGEDSLTLDYYVLPENLERARRQFAQVKPMLESFEYWFGPYPFARDGFKLVESPHLGMEHQSAIAYGNGYRNGYRGTSSSAYGLLFDFIIVHESAHEWWGNSVTARDPADMWIHESFGAYAEALYLERQLGAAAALDYVVSRRTRVRNDAPIAGPPNVNREGSSDMYDKGQLVLNTLRHAMHNDSLWRATLRALQREYRHRTVSREDIVGCINRTSGVDWTPFFDQYLGYRTLPRLELSITRSGSETSLRYRWRADVATFDMPVRLDLVAGRDVWLRPTSAWTVAALGDVQPEEIHLPEREFYCDVSLDVTHLLPGERGLDRKKK